MSNGNKHFFWAVSAYILFIYLNYKKHWLDLDWLTIGAGAIVVFLYYAIPDIDQKIPFIKHRGFSHSLPMAIVFALPLLIGSKVLFGIAVGAILLHLILDRLF